MNLNVHFAKPVSIYNNYVNKCTGKYCHCEVSIELDAQLLSVIIDSAVQNAYDPECVNFWALGFSLPFYKFINYKLLS